MQKALFEEEDHVKKLQQKVATLEKRNKQLRERVKKVKRSLRQARKNGRHLELLNRKLSEKLAAAAVDRIVYHGRLVEFGGKSRRVEHSLMLGNRQEE